MTGTSTPPVRLGHDRGRAHTPGLLGLLAALAIGLFVALVGLPIVGLVLRVPSQQLLQHLRSPWVTQAVWLSVWTSASATLGVVLLGLPVAQLLATRQFRGRRVLEILIDLPMVLPPTVAGFGLLLAFGRSGLLGPAFSVAGVSIPFTSVAVVIAQMFVAGPFFINAARAGFEAVEPRYVQAAATLRASDTHIFVRVVLPLSVPSLLAGGAMTWARALGEFGATITFAGNLPGRTQTMPLAVYSALQSDVDAAVALSVILLAVSCALLAALRTGRRRY
jgi:molybdate transport system permease protein